jgi:hypothetical protein
LALFVFWVVSLNWRSQHFISPDWLFIDRQRRIECFAIALCCHDSMQVPSHLHQIMTLSNHLNQLNRPPQADKLPRKAGGLPTVDIHQELEKLALILAQTWRDEHAEANPNSEETFENCVAYITAEMAKAGAAVGGPAGLAILTGGGSAAARIVCKRLFWTGV